MGLPPRLVIVGAVKWHNWQKELRFVKYSWQTSLTVGNPGGKAIRDASRRNEGEKSGVVARAAVELMFGVTSGVA